MQLMPHATFYARSEFQMILSIVFSKPGRAQTESMEQPTTLRWINQQRFLSWVSQTPELTHPKPTDRKMEFKTSSYTKAQVLCFASSA